MTRHTELAYDENIQWSVQFPRDFECDWNPSPGEPKDQKIRAIPVFLKAPGKDLPSLGAISKIHVHLPVCGSFYI
jgi:hypothetical protein